LTVPVVELTKAEDAGTPAESAEISEERKSPKLSAKKRRIITIAAVVVAVASAGAGGVFGPKVYDMVTAPSYLGADASMVAKALGCSDYKQDSKKDTSVYSYHDAGTCTLDDVTIRITTFDDAADGQAFDTLLRGVTKILHPTWQGATYASGPGWNVADSVNLTPRPAESAVIKLGQGATHIIQ
jgi:hypothetical protein